MAWGAFIQGGEDWERINLAGISLNLHIQCAIHYPAYDKRLFECNCGVVFPVFAVEAAMQADVWEHIHELHKSGIRGS